MVAFLVLAMVAFLVLSDVNIRILERQRKRNKKCKKCQQFSNGLECLLLHKTLISCIYIWVNVFLVRKLESGGIWFGTRYVSAFGLLGILGFSEWWSPNNGDSRENQKYFMVHGNGYCIGRGLVQGSSFFVVYGPEKLPSRIILIFFFFFV